LLIAGRLETLHDCLAPDTCTGDCFGDKDRFRSAVSFVHGSARAHDYDVETRPSLLWHGVVDELLCECCTQLVEKSVPVSVPRPRPLGLNGGQQAEVTESQGRWCPAHRRSSPETEKFASPRRRQNNKRMHGLGRTELH
jgi:hypothetical protein